MSLPNLSWKSFSESRQTSSWPWRSTALRALLCLQETHYIYLRFQTISTSWISRLVQCTKLWVKLTGFLSHPLSLETCLPHCTHMSLKCLCLTYIPKKGHKNNLGYRKQNTVFTKTLVLLRVMVLLRPTAKPQAEGGSTGQADPAALPLHPSKPRWAHRRVICDAVSLQGNLSKPPSQEERQAEVRLRKTRVTAGFGAMHS